MTADTLLVLLVVFLIAMYILAMLYLRRRRLTPRQFLGWGLLALLVPLLGPFLVIASRPGSAPQPRRRKQTRPEVSP
jgi:hypothetical protein